MVEVSEKFWGKRHFLRTHNFFCRKFVAFVEKIATSCAVAYILISRRPGQNENLESAVADCSVPVYRAIFAKYVATVPPGVAC